MYTARRGGGAFCNGRPIRVSSQEGGGSSGPRQQVAPSPRRSHSLLYFSVPDINRSLVLTEMGFKKDPECFKTMLANVHAILTIPVHGYV